jgi:hypothetical protein
MSRRQLFLVAFWAAALFTVVMASLPKPPALPGRPEDKIQHILAFATLAGLAAAAYPRTSLVKLGLGLSVFGALIEMVQMIPMLHRDAEAADWLADSAAAAAILIVAAVIRGSTRRA